ncbi:hypothetical protein M9Y10_001699 [Tritrichomonas musculus]|uniref:Trafficking protein particle complex subunit 11 domain-containing protein n=1 Tax=Tritrichomonas musculus TaxID=1915356 RepID=A0ABR2L7P1_9EUKA
MDDYHLLVTYTDFYGVWKKKIQPSLIREGPLSINLELPIQSDITQNCNYFSPQFVESEEGESLCQLFIIAYDSKFDTNQTTEINIWRSKNPGKAFLVLILSIAKTQWSFTTQRSKIESLFNQVVPTSRVVIAKYLLDKEESVSDSDLKLIHSSLANLIQISNQDQIRTLQQKMTDIEAKGKNIGTESYAKMSAEYIKVSTELASLYHTFGFLSQSKEIYHKVISIIMKISDLGLLQFWPPSPINYDIRRLTSKIKFDYGFNMLISSIHGITKSLMQSNKISELFVDIAHCFYIVLLNSITPEQLIFTRYWIYSTSVNFCDMIISGPSSKNNDSTVQSFSMIALSQILKLLEYSYRIQQCKSEENDKDQEKSNLNEFLSTSEIMDFIDADDYEKTLNFDINLDSPFLKQVSTDNLALVDASKRDEIFLEEWKRSSKIFENLPKHKSFTDSVLFEYYLSKNNFKDAMATIEKTPLDPVNHNKRRISAIESHILELVFSYPDLKTPELAKQLISCIGAKDISKMRAIEYLAALEDEIQVSPDFTISPFLFAPGLYDAHDIYDNFHFSLTIKFPKWLCDLTDTMKSLQETDESDNNSNIKKVDYDNDDDESLENVEWFVPIISIHLLSSELPDGFSMMMHQKHYDSLSEKMVIEGNINCNYPGRFDIMMFIIKFGNCYLSWEIKMSQKLVILERVAPPSFDLTMPCLIQKDCLQSAIFTAENIDASSMEVTFTFEMDGLEEVIYLKPINTSTPLGSNTNNTSSSVLSPRAEKNEPQQQNQPSSPSLNLVLKGRRKSYQEFIQSEPEQFSLSNYEEIHYKPNIPIILRKFESTVKIILVYKMKSDDAVGVAFTFLKRDGTSQTLTQTFTVPEIKSFNIRLFKQTAKMQQFQIVNIFPQTFTFTFNGKKHVMLPHALYSIVREASDAPLELVFVEEGWEKYPVKLVTSNFMRDKLRVKLVVQPIQNINHQIPKSKSEVESTNKEANNKHEEEDNANDTKKVASSGSDDNDSDNLSQAESCLTPWIVGEPRLVIVDPPAFPMLEDEKNWVVAPQDSLGKAHLFFPKHPGKLSFPKFQIKQQVAEPIPKDVEIMFNLYPPIVPL